MTTAALPAAPFTRARLAELGLRPTLLRSLIDRGEVIRLLRGVYVPAGLEVTHLLRVQAVSLVVDPGHVACDRTAAWIHGIDSFTSEESVVLPPIEICSLRGTHQTERADADGHTRDLEPADIMSIGGLRVTTPTRTALDLACLLRRREAYAVLNEFARHHAITKEQLGSELRRRYRGRRGVVQARALIPLVDPRLESQRESWTLLEILEAGLPAPEPQFWIEIDGVRTYRLDFAYPAFRIAIEYDGQDWHDRTDEQRDNDRARRRWLRDNGWTVIVLTQGCFTGIALDRWIDELRLALQPTYSNRRW